MRRVAGQLVFSPTDLVGFLACAHATQLDRAVLAALLEKPVIVDAELDLLRTKGLEHEHRYRDRLAAAGLRITSIEQAKGEAGLLAAREETLAAMRRGDEVIYQATFVEGGWSGQADFLRRVERPGDPTALGPYGYEPEDTKLALHPKAGALLQLLTYARMIEAVQGRPPERVHVVLGRASAPMASFRVADYAAYHRLVVARFEELVLRGSAPDAATLATVVDPVEQCGVCAFAEHCRTLRYRSGHLSRVAFLGRNEAAKLRAAGIGTVQALGGLTAPFPRVEGMAAETLARLQDQAAMQLEEERRVRDGVEPARFHKVLPHDPEPPARGLLALPAPTPADLFFDFEGDRFAEEGGLEYLFGWVETAPAGGTAEDAPFLTLWAHDRAAEKRALESFVDLVVERRRQDPGMHVYHYSAYEPSALHRLTNRHGTRQEELDTLLRAGVFVDLYAVVRQGIRVSSWSYSIKKLEALYDFDREIDLKQAVSSMIAYERWRATGDPAILAEIADYNRDDCRSTLRLRDYLEACRDELVATLGADPGRPPLLDGAPSESQQEADTVVAQVRAALLAGIEEETAASGEDATAGEAEPTEPPDVAARRLLGDLLGWHRRESRSDWFEWFRLRDLEPDALLRDATPLVVSPGPEDLGPVDRSRRWRWRFDGAQETKLAVGDEVTAVPTPDGGDPFSAVGRILRLDLEAGEVELKVSVKRDPIDLDGFTAFLPTIPLRTTNQRASLLELGRWVAEHGIDVDGPNRAVRDILLGRPPRLREGAGGGPLLRAGEEPSAAARRLAADLDRSYLAIQGPPGSGKTWTGAKIVLDLVADARARGVKRTIGITAFSHAAIGNLLDAIVALAPDGFAPRILQKAEEHQAARSEGVIAIADNGIIDLAIASGGAEIVGGTAWLWSRPELTGSLDTLIVDEAGQLSLANVAAIGRATENLVLLGDPQQLSQPLKGAHPPGAGASVLEHVLGPHQAIPPELGVFLATTRRLHPRICSVTSELFYESKLLPLPGLETQAIEGPPDGLSGAGLRYLPVEHARCSNSSPAEAEAVAALARSLIGRRWVPAAGSSDSARLIGTDDILVVSPYNAQVARLRSLLPEGVRAGTVDKFQGQQAPVVLYSMATSTPDDMPRDMSFLFSLNRFNVATSRAQALVVLVCSPALLAVACRTPEQMRLANALARFVELAEPIALPEELLAAT